jgi:putative FmdB family regulatory protein
MPTYEYACQGCDREFEADQRITEDPLKSCPHRKSKKVKRLISKTSFVLKGGGWYSDLYSSSKAGEKPSDKDSSKSSTSTDSKSDAKDTKKTTKKSEGKTKSKATKKNTG